jgi:hypothetical protein
MGDPLNPIVPVEPPVYTPPDTTRVQRIERDQQREPAPDWERSPKEGSEDEPDEQFDDGYDPNWGKWDSIEQAGEDERPDESMTGPEEARQPDSGHDRRAESTRADDGDDEPRQHIDIIA